MIQTTDRLSTATCASWPEAKKSATPSRGTLYRCPTPFDLGHVATSHIPPPPKKNTPTEQTSTTVLCFETINSRQASKQKLPSSYPSSRIPCATRETVERQVSTTRSITDVVAGATTKIVSGGDAVIRGIIRATERDAAAAARAAAAVALKFFLPAPAPAGRACRATTRECECVLS